MPGFNSNKFKVNDYVCYGTSGVCVVEDVGALNMKSADPAMSYYHLMPLYEKGSAIYTPVERGNSFMRSVMTGEEARDLLGRIGNIQEIFLENDRTKERVYAEILRTNDAYEIIRLIKTLGGKKEARQATGRQLDQTDSKYLRMAENLIYGEVAVSLDMSKEQVEDYLDRQLELKKPAV